MKALNKLIARHAQLVAMPYGKARNYALCSVQRKLEHHGLFNQRGSLIRPIVRTGRGTLAVGGGK